nr:MAG TPA_asm: N-glycosylation protein [Caudoviricetes sp.]
MTSFLATSGSFQFGTTGLMRRWRVLLLPQQEV